MRMILARLPGAVVFPRLLLLPLLALALLLAVVTRPPERFFFRTLHGAGQVSEHAAERLRYRVEPVIVFGGMMVSRNRNTIAGAATGCAAGAAIGAASTAAIGLLTGGAGLAAVPVGAGLGCLAGGMGGAALGYPLDTWALTE